MKPIANALSKFNWGTRACSAFVLCATTAIALPAQTLTTLHSFDGADGSTPSGALVQGIDGNFYGAAPYLGANGLGTIFKITPSGTLTTLHSFDGTDGSVPNGALIQASNGDFHGTTDYGGYGGDYGAGTVFKITPSGTLTTLYSFCGQSGCPDGQYPSSLSQATNGDFYGTTISGGAYGGGTIFKINPQGALTTLYSFCSLTGCADGSYPYVPPVQATNGDLYGTTGYGGTSSACGTVGCGTVFKITLSGTLTTLHSFDGTDGATPQAVLVQATNGDFYGTTDGGGANNAGTVFKITPSGTLTTLHSFCGQSGCPDGEGPSGLVQATNGDLYGVTNYAGANSGGTVFKITPAGRLTTVYSFCSQSGCTDGNLPDADLIQATNGDFYGTTFAGGTNNNADCSAYTGVAGGCGTVFRLSVGLGPFVKTQPTSGKVGAAIEILGTDLASAASVNFNGTAAVFTVNSRGSAISTTVPTGATTGDVQVVTLGGTLTSNVPFRVP
jgi:uncharacterized repeat protein (TIGR03803 family)